MTPGMWAVYLPYRQMTPGMWAVYPPAYWVRGSLYWVPGPLYWVRCPLYWVPGLLYWVHGSLYWVRRFLHWVRGPLYWVCGRVIPSGTPELRNPGTPELAENFSLKYEKIGFVYQKRRCRLPEIRVCPPTGSDQAGPFRRRYCSDIFIVFWKFGTSPGPRQPVN